MAIVHVGLFAAGAATPIPAGNIGACGNVNAQPVTRLCNQRSTPHSDWRSGMSKRMPIHALKDTLEQARFQAIQVLASAGGTIPLLSDDALRRIALIQAVLVAGGGAEQPLE
jgi:hypothetical protein